MRSVVSVSGVALLLIVALTQTQAEIKPPTVNVYTQYPVENGIKNTVICHGSGFHPPRIGLRLMRNGEEISGCQQTDLSFERDWTYYLSKYINIVIKDSDVIECEVTHNGGTPQTYRLDSF